MTADHPPVWRRGLPILATAGVLALVGCTGLTTPTDGSSPIGGGAGGTPTAGVLAEAPGRPPDRESRTDQERVRTARSAAGGCAPPSRRRAGRSRTSASPAATRSTSPSPMAVGGSPATRRRHSRRPSRSPASPSAAPLGSTARRGAGTGWSSRWRSSGSSAPQARSTSPTRAAGRPTGWRPSPGAGPRRGGRPHLPGELADHRGREPHPRPEAGQGLAWRRVQSGRPSGPGGRTAAAAARCCR